MGSAPFYITADRAVMIAQNRHGTMTITNISNVTVYLDDLPSVSASSFDYVLYPGSQVLWNENVPCYAIAAVASPPADGILNVSFNVQNFQNVTNFTPQTGRAVITGGTVTSFVGNGINGVNGTTYAVHSWTVSGSLVCDVTTMVEYFMIGGGAAGNGANYYGGPGAYLSGWLQVPPGTFAVTVGAGGIIGAPLDRYGRASEIASLAVTPLAPVFDFVSAFSQPVGDGGTLGAPLDGVTTQIRGVAETYGQPQQAFPAVNRGDGANNGAGSAGIVVIRYAA
jgi:hypothetical protein